MSIKHKLRMFFWKLGYDVTKFSPESNPIALRKQLLVDYEIDTVLDVGANSGQFARTLRSNLGYKGRILSFEPLSSAFSLLQKNARNIAGWETFNFALGNEDAMREINIAGNSDSSSLLEMLNSHVQLAPESAYVGRENIEVRKLDSVYPKLCAASRNIYLKIDTQGFEQQVLNGAERSLANIDTVQMEMSLVQLYQGEPLFYTMSELMYTLGYELVSMEPSFSDKKSGRLLQIDGVFHRFSPGGVGSLL